MVALLCLVLWLMLVHPSRHSETYDDDDDLSLLLLMMMSRPCCRASPCATHSDVLNHHRTLANQHETCHVGKCEKNTSQREGSSNVRFCWDPVCAGSVFGLELVPGCFWTHHNPCDQRGSPTQSFVEELVLCLCCGRCTQEILRWTQATIRGPETFVSTSLRE